MAFLSYISKFTLIRHFTVRPRLAIVIVLGILLWICLPAQWRAVTRVLIAWDSATGLYLILVAYMMAHSDIAKIQKRAASQDEGSVLILALTTFTAIASLVAIVAELANAKNLTGQLRWEHIALSALTVLLSWTFMQTMFALHYAHEYYQSDTEGPSQGLEFPAKFTNPDYWDFVYFSFIIGTAAQTADINIISGAIRKVVTVHCMTVFFFNTTILALTVNIGAGLF